MNLLHMSILFRNIKSTKSPRDIYADIIFVKKNYETAVVDVKIAPKSAWFATIANSQQQCVNGFKWD